MVTQDQLKALFEYKDGGLYWRVSRSRRAAGARAGNLRRDGYRQVRIDRKLHLEHRLVYLLHHGYTPAFLDHINGDKADNRLENLRQCTKRQNNYNAKLRSDNTSGVKGVSWSKAKNKWKTQLNIDSKKVHFGYFRTSEEARGVVEAARAKYHGEFAHP